MSAQDHAVIEAAVRAKRLKQQSQHSTAAAAPAKPASIANKAVTAGIWVAAAGSLAALMIGG